MKNYRTITLWLIIVWIIPNGFPLTAQNKIINQPVITQAVCEPDTVIADNQSVFRVQARVSDPDGMANLMSVEVDLSPLGSSASAQMYDDGTHGDLIAGDSIYTRGNITVPLNWPAGLYPLTITAVDLQNHSTQETAWIYVLPVNVPPVVSSVIASPEVVLANGQDEFSITAQVVDDNIASVKVDLSVIGGDTAVWMADIGGGLYSVSGLTVAPGTSPGIYSLTVLATDMQGLTDTETGLLQVVGPNEAPVIHWIVCRPPVLRPDAQTVFAVMAKVTDNIGPSGIVSVSLDLSALQGPPSVLMNDNGMSGDSAALDSIYSIDGLTVPVSVSPGNYPLMVTVVDQHNLTRYEIITVTVQSNQPPSITDVQFTPAAVYANGQHRFRIRVWANDPDGLTDIERVWADFSSVGVPSQIWLFDDGSHGDETPGDGIFTRDSLVVPPGYPAGLYLITAFVKDLGGLNSEYTAFLEVLDPLAIPGDPIQPSVFALHPNYPNPFNPSTTISFDVPRSAFVRIKIFDALGREVYTLIEKSLSPGRYHIRWNGKDYHGRVVASGVYFCRMLVSFNISGKSVFTRKMLIIK